MPSFEITAPDGSIYDIEGQDEVGAFGALQKHLGSQRNEGSPRNEVRPMAPSESQPPPGRAPLVPGTGPSAAELAAQGGGRHQGLGQEAGAIGQNIYDAARVANRGLTFGLSDRLAGYLGGQGAEAERAKTEASASALGTPGTIATETAASLVPFGGISRAVGLGAKAAEGIPLVGRIAASPTAQAAATGGTAGGLSAIGNETPLGPGIGLGAAAGVAGKAVGDLAGMAMGPKAIAAKTAAELKAEGTANYGRAFEKPVYIKSPAIQKLSQDVGEALSEFGYHPELQSAVKPALEEIQNLATGQGTVASSLKGLDTIRKIAGHAATSIDPSTRAAAGIVTGKLDDIMQNLRPADIVGSVAEANAAARALKEAQTGWRTMRKTEMLEQIISNAENTAAGSGSGGNINNALRQGFKGILNSPKKARNFNPEELSTIKAVTKGASIDNLARLVGKLGPSGNGLMLALTAAHAGYSPATGIPLAIAGAGAKKFSDTVTRSRAERALATVAGGGKALPKPPKKKFDTIGRSLASLGVLNQDEFPTR